MRLTNILSKRNTVLAFSIALFAVAWMTSAALAAGTCGISRSAADCSIDSSGCEIAQGFLLTNNCNAAARGDGHSFWVTHRYQTGPSEDAPHINSFRAGGTGSSSYVSLYCVNSLTTSLFRGQLQTGESKTCVEGWPVNYAYRSVCGPNSACMNK